MPSNIVNVILKVSLNEKTLFHYTVLNTTELSE